MEHMYVTAYTLTPTACMHNKARCQTVKLLHPVPSSLPPTRRQSALELPALEPLAIEGSTWFRVCCTAKYNKGVLPTELLQEHLQNIEHVLLALFCAM